MNDNPITRGTGEDDIACIPPPPPPPAEMDPTSDPRDGQLLWSFLQQETYRQRGEGFRGEWAFHIHAANHNLGAPLMRSARGAEQVAAGGRRYGFQPFARDTIFNEIPLWTQVQSLNSLIDGTIPASGLEREMLEASYLASGAALRPTQAFAQLAVRERLGPALSEGFTIAVDGTRYDMQLFALDTLASPVGQPTNIIRLSAASTGNLREALWRETYRLIGGGYDTSSPFHQLGARERLGTPLSGVYRADFAGMAIDIQVFALDTLYARPGSAPARQSALPRPMSFDMARAIPPELSVPEDAMSDRTAVFNVLPLAGQPRISQFYGYTRFAAGAGRQFYGATQGQHSGVDFAVPLGTPLLAMDFGLVVWAGPNVSGVSFGAGPRSIIVRYGNVYALYGHTESEAVRKGQMVGPGQELGRSGFPSAPHLHFELRPVPERVMDNHDPNQNPANPGFAVNPLDHFSADLRTYFEQQLARLGGNAHFCRGSFGDQARIMFGAPVDQRPCV
jgi:murein DD-endopeptidase MepM/ murein hydrolase activator NlpD